MKILIIGGGVAGPAFAGFTKKYDLGEVVLIERAPEFHTIGYVIALWGNGRRILKKLDMDRDVAEKLGYEINWNASDYPSGVYYSTLTAGPYTYTKKMVLIK